MTQQPDYNKMNMNNSTRRNHSLDLLRALGVFGIVWFHGTSAQQMLGHNISLSGLMIFIIISFYLLVPRWDVQKTISSRINRLLLPWVFWFCIYGIFNVMAGEALLPERINFMSAILAGPSIHLWYLPFVFLASMTIICLARNIPAQKSNGVASILILLPVLTLATTPVWQSWSYSLGYPWAQWFHAFTAVLVGVAFGYSEFILKSRRKIIVLTVLVTLVSILLVAYEYYIGIHYLVGTGAFAILLHCNVRFTDHSIIKRISECSYGIYLIHPLFYHSLVFSQLKKIELEHESVLIIIVFLLSFLSILMIKKVAPPFVQKII